MKSGIRKWFVLFIVLDLVIVAYVAGAWYFAGILVAFDSKTLAEDKARGDLAEPQELGLPAPENVTIDTGEVALAGWFFENPAEGNCGVILLHGHTGTRYGAIRFAPLFWGHGCDIVAFDARYHGESSGDYGTYGYHESDDTLAVVDWLATQSDIPSENIGLMGTSYGASTVLQAAAKRSDLAFVAADSSFEDLITIVTLQGVRQYGPWVKLFVPGAFLLASWRADFDPAATSPMLAAQQIAIPVFISHSLQDSYTPPNHSEAIFANVPHERKVLHLTDWGAEHSGSIDTNFAGYQAQIDSFLAEFVPQIEN